MEDSSATPTEKGTQQSDEHRPFRLDLHGLSKKRRREFKVCRVSETNMDAQLPLATIRSADIHRVTVDGMDGGYRRRWIALCALRYSGRANFCINTVGINSTNEAETEGSTYRYV